MGASASARLPRADRGFTLLETLVALAVLATALTALTAAAGSSARQIDALRTRTLAGWVAENRVSEILLAKDAPADGERRGEATLAGRRWRWHERVAPTADPALVRVEVEVRPADAPPTSSPAAALVAFRGRGG